MTYDRSVRTWLRLAACAALALMMGAAPLASGQVSDVYLLSSFSNNGNSFNASQPIYIVNPGGDSELSSVCASIYVFDSQQEMLECCSCPISNNGLLTLTVKDLTSNSVTAVAPKSGVIKIVSSATASNGSCSATSISPQPRLRAWMVNLQVATIPPPVFFFPQGTSTPTPVLSVTAFDQSALSAVEQAFLPLACQFVAFAGRGSCSCPAGG